LSEQSANTESFGGVIEGKGSARAQTMAQSTEFTERKAFGVFFSFLVSHNIGRLGGNNNKRVMRRDHWIPGHQRVERVMYKKGFCERMRLLVNDA